MNYYDYFVNFRDNYLASVLSATTYPYTTTNAGYTVDFGEKDKVVADVEYVELSSEPVKEKEMTVGTLIDLAVGLDSIDRDTKIDLAENLTIASEAKYVYSDADNKTIILSADRKEYLKHANSIFLIWEDEKK